MPVRVQARVTFQSTSNIPADNVSNSFCFYNSTSIDKDDNADLDNVLDLVEDFYTVVGAGGGEALGRFINNTIKRQAVIKLYDFADAHPRPPIAERLFTLPNVISTNNLPAEVALVGSFQADQVAGQPQRRRRGRIYLGPLCVSSANNTNPPASMINALAARLDELRLAANASILWDWHVYSPTNANSVKVDNGWVDNTWDTQRRRGPKSTSRTVFP